MKVVSSILVMIFTFLMSLTGLALILQKENKIVIEEEKILVVKVMEEPRGFKVIFNDENGKEYLFEKQWCENYKQYMVGSKHKINLTKTIYTQVISGRTIIREEEEFIIKC